MTTIASRLAQTSFTSSSPQEARKRALYLYRAWCRSSQEVVDLYALNVPPSAIRNAIRRRFEANRHVTDKKAVDVLLLKGWQEYQETMNVWKQPDHIYGILLEDQGASRPPRTFLQKFYEGKDEDAVLPAASGTY